MIDWTIYLGAYLAAGLSLKVGDDLLDEMEAPSLAWGPLALSGFLFGTLMSTSEWDLVLLGSIVIGVILSGKVNRKEFIIGFVMIGVALLLVDMPQVTEPLERASLLIILFMAAVLDEKGTNWIDKGVNPFTYLFFEHRFTLKVTAVLLAIPWSGFLPAAIGLWMFDLGYEIADVLMKQVRTTEED